MIVSVMLIQPHQPISKDDPRPRNPAVSLIEYVGYREIELQSGATVWGLFTLYGAQTLWEEGRYRQNGHRQDLVRRIRSDCSTM